MATFTSKTLIPGQTPVGQNRDGSYIYEEVMSKATTAPKPITPIYTPPTALPMVKSPLGFNTVPQVNKQVAQKVNAPVKDTLGLNSKIDSTSERTTQLRSHFSYLEDKGELFLNDKQSDYIKRFKTKYPDYQNVPDAILYGKVILADPKTMEKYGNIGEKSFLRNLTETPFNIAKAGGESINRGIDLYEQGLSTVSGKVTAFDKIMAAIPATLRAGGEGLLGIGGEILNTADKARQLLPGKAGEDFTPYSTKFSEDFGNTFASVAEKGIQLGDKITQPVAKFIQDFIPQEFQQDVRDANARNPNVIPQLQYMLESGMEIANLLPFLKVKGPSPAWVDELASKKWAGEDALQFLKDKTKQGAEGLNSYLGKLPEERLPGPGVGTKITRTIPEKTVSNYLGLTPTERGNVEKILGGKTAEQYILENNLGGKTKGELTDIFQKQASDSYNGIKEKLAPIADRIDSKGAKTAIDDMLETFDSLSSLEKDIYKRDIDYLKTLKEQSDFSLSELHALRQAFDKVNTGMYTAKGAVRSGTRAGAEVEVRNMLSNDIQENAIKYGVDVKKMNQDLRVALTLKDGLLRSLSQESKNNLVGLQDIGIMGIFSGGEPLTALSLGIGKKFLEGKMPSAAQKLYNLNKTPYENTAVKRGNTISTGNGSRLFGLSDSMGSDSASGLSKVDIATPTSVTPVATTPGKSLAISADNGMDAKKLLEGYKKLSPEEQAKARLASPKLAEIVEVDTVIKDVQEFKGDFGYIDEQVLNNLGKKYLTYSQEAKEMIRKGLDKEDLATIQKINRQQAGLPEPVQEVKAKKKPVDTMNEKIDSGTPETPLEAPIETPKVESIPEAPKTTQEGKTVPKEILDEMKKYDNSDDFAKGVLKSGTKETKGQGQAKILRKKIEDIKTKALGLDKSSPGFAKLDKEFLRLTKELSAIDGEDALTKVLGKNEYDLEKNIETLKKFYNDNKPKQSLPAVEGKTPLLRKKDVNEGRYDFDEVVSRYTEDMVNEKPGAKARVIDSDVLKKMFAEYDPKNPGLVHEESKILADKIFKKYLQDDKSGEIVFSAGGPASGKTEGVVSRYIDRDNIIYDHLLSNFESFKKKYKQAIDAGKKVKVHAIYTDIETAKAYNKMRGREVADIEQKHKDFRNAIADLINSKEYKEGNIDLQVSINTPLGNVLVDKDKISSFVKKFKNRLDI